MTRQDFSDDYDNTEAITPSVARHNSGWHLFFSISKAST